MGLSASKTNKNTDEVITERIKTFFGLTVLAVILAVLVASLYLTLTVLDKDDVRTIVQEEYAKQIPVASPAFKSLEYAFRKQIEEVADEHKKQVVKHNASEFNKYKDRLKSDLEFQKLSMEAKEYKFVREGTEYKVVKKGTGSYILASFLAAAEDYLSRFGKDEEIDFFKDITRDTTSRESVNVNRMSNEHHAFFAKFLRRLQIAVETTPDTTNNRMWVNHHEKTGQPLYNLDDINSLLIKKMELKIICEKKPKDKNPYRIHVEFESTKSYEEQFPNQ